jgi:hypothetical protein
MQQNNTNTLSTDETTPQSQNQQQAHIQVLVKKYLDSLFQNKKSVTTHIHLSYQYPNLRFGGNLYQERKQVETDPK